MSVSGQCSQAQVDAAGAWHGGLADAPLANAKLASDNFDSTTAVGLDTGIP